MNVTAPPSLVVEDRVRSWLTGLPVGAPRPAPPQVTPLDASLLRSTLGPAALIFTTPFVVVLVWMACLHYDGSLVALLAAGPADWLRHVPAPTPAAVAVIAGWVAFQALLLRVLPGADFLGPVTPAGVQPAYKLNGVAAWVVTHGLLVGAWLGGLFRAADFYQLYGSLLVTLNVGALLFCAFLYWKGRRYPSSPDAVVTGNLLFDFFQGPELHPRLFGMGLKQLINCRVSMMGWSAVFVLFAMAQHELRPEGVSTAMLASMGVLVVYLFKFFVWEGGYFHSMDIMHDRFGYYICWGVLVWVPAIYCLVALWLVEHPIDWHPAVAAGMFLLGVLAIWINYQADEQRQRVRATNGATTVWGKAPTLIRARYTPADGKERESLLLVSGWWGVARHFHYVPELLLAFAWTVPAGFTHFLPWFYWIFLFILLMDRAVRDERRCAKKYGPAWDAYCRAVPWRVVPYVY